MIINDYYYYMNYMNYIMIIIRKINKRFLYIPIGNVKILVPIFDKKSMCFFMKTYAFIES